MKKQKHVFNESLRRYKKYLRKLSRLTVTGRNTHRQAVLSRHIQRLKEKLESLYISIKGATAIVAVSAMCVVAAPEASAQISFGTVQQNPFGLVSNGGNNSLPTFADLDNDGDEDMMSGDYNGYFKYYENTGTKSAPAFAAAQINPFSLSNNGNYSSIALEDLDADGDLDLMAGDYNGNLTYFENTGTISAPAFAPAQVNPFGLSNISSYSSSPTFTDLDEDGDLDLMVGDYNGNFTYFENTGAASAPAFAAAQVNPFGLTYTGNNSSSPTFTDLDNDGDLDIMSGQADENFKYFENTGTASAPAFAALENNPFSLNMLSLGYFVTPTFADLDADGDMDLLSGDYNGNFFYFENTTPIPITPCFAAVQENPFSLGDNGFYAHASFADLDDDGDMDMMTGGNTTDLQYFENKGTSSAPDFAAVQNNPFSLSNSRFQPKPAFGDLDGDGDLDLMIGNTTGTLVYFENTGTVSAPAFAVAQESPFSLSDVGKQSTATFGDLDGDGDLDIMVGEQYGDFWYFENSGTASAPTFAAVQINPFSLSDIGKFSTANLADLDGDGDLDLMTGEKYGDFVYFENTGTALAPAFASAQIHPFSLYYIGFNPSPALVDLNGDGALDLMSGEFYGNFKYFENIALPLRVTWDGETSTDWGTATNWVDDILPISTDDVLIANTANDPVITTDIEVNSIYVKTSAVVTVSTNSLKVTNDITLDGNMAVTSGASLIPLGTITGAGTATIHRNTTFGVTDGRYSVIGSPITAGSTSSLGSIVYSYDETVAYDPRGTAGSARFSSVSTPEAMAVGDAYFSANTGSISFVGTPNAGNIDVPLVYDETRDEGAINAGFNLVSNPYPASILFPTFVTANPDMDGAIYVWDDGGSDIADRTNADYIVATNGMGITGGSGRIGDADGYIRSTQGFFVKATTAGTLHFTPSMMATTNNSDAGYFRTEKPTILRFALSSDQNYSDILLGFSDNTTEAFDRNYDAYKFKGNSVLQLSSKMGESLMAIQALPRVEEEIEVNLEIDIAKAGMYTFELEEASSYGFKVYLKDVLLDRLIDLSDDNSYIFQSTSVSSSDRFSLIFSPQTVLNIEDQFKFDGMIVYSDAFGLNVNVLSKPSNARVKIYNLSGTLMKEVNHVDFSEGNWTTSFTEQGLFIMSVQANGQLFIKKFIK